MWSSEKKICSRIGKDLIINGDIHSKSYLVVEGRVEGNVSSISLHVGKTGLISGGIFTKDVIVEGTIHGMIESENVDLRDGCKLLGDIASHTLSMEHGAVFNGAVKPNKDKIKPKLTVAAE